MAQQVQPKFETNVYDPSSKYDFKMRVAIDFGTDGIGMLLLNHVPTRFRWLFFVNYILLALAYGFGETNQVFAHTKWSTNTYEAQVKPKTIILLDEDHDVIGFGKDAKHTFSVVSYHLHNFHNNHNHTI